MPKLERRISNLKIFRAGAQIPFECDPAVGLPCALDLVPGLSTARRQEGLDDERASPAGEKSAIACECHMLSACVEVIRHDPFLMMRLRPAASARRTFAPMRSIRSVDPVPRFPRPRLPRHEGGYSAPPPGRSVAPSS